MGWHDLRHLIEPQSIAVFGASERADSVGGRVYENLLSGGFGGSVFAVNPKHQRVLDRPCYAAVGDIRQPVDLAVIATPAATVPGIIRECGEHGVVGAVILSSGFRRSGETGSPLAAQLLDTARRYRIRLLGPNCLGIIRPAVNLNATFSRNMAHPGRLALVSQSGALCTAILDWAGMHQVGFSLIASIGDAVDVGFGELLDFLALDANTNSILLYIEGVSNARSFMSGLRAAARIKPVIVVKAGRHQAASRAAMTHTGALVGADDVFDAALRRAGAVRAMTIEQLFAAAQLLATCSGVQGNRLAVVTNGGGPGVMAVDRAVDLGIELAALDAATMARLDGVLPADWSHANPVDILGDALPQRYGDSVTACLEDPAVNGVLVMLTPQAMTQPLEAAQAVVTAASVKDKPVLACWMGEDQVAAGRDLFSRHQLPVFPNPEAAVEAFAYLYDHYVNRKLLLQVPGPMTHRDEPDVEGARLIIESALAQGRNMLSIAEARALLRAFDIPVVEARSAGSAAEALVAAETLGFPVVMKIDSPDVSHKSDVGGVRLDVTDAQSVRRVYQELVATIQRHYPDKRITGVTVEPMVRTPSGRELLIGVATDPVFGPVVSFGAGGTAVEVMQDRAVALPPLNQFIARDLIGRTKIARLLATFRNLPPANIEAVEYVLLRVSALVCELDQIRELDINPLIVDEKGAVAVDARIAVLPRPPASRRYGHMAIHPYPGELTGHWQLADGTDIKIRPIRPEDAQMERGFVRDLSPRSRYLRFMHSFTELTADMLARLTQIDYDKEMAFVALARVDGQEKEIGVARYAMDLDGDSCEFAIVIADEWQHKGIGAHLMRVLMDTARNRGFKYMRGEILAENVVMCKLVQELGFDVTPHPEERGIQVASKSLTDEV